MSLALLYLFTYCKQLQTLPKYRWECVCVCILDGHIESWQWSLPSVLWKFEEKQTKVTTTHIGRGQCRTSRMSTYIVQTSCSALFPNQWATSQWTILQEPLFPSDVIPCLKAATVKGGVCVTHKRNQWHFSLLPLCVQEQNKTVEKYSQVKVVYCWLAPRKGTGRNWSCFSYIMSTALPRMGWGSVTEIDGAIVLQ